MDECGVEMMSDADQSLGKVSLGHTPNLQRSIFTPGNLW